MLLWKVLHRIGQAFFLAFFTSLSLARAAPVEESLVYIECLDDEENVVSRDSGVLISANGRVLTARYVIPEKFEQNCRGSIVVADSNDSKRLILQPDSTGDPVRVLRFQSGSFPFARFCALPPHAIRAPIVVAGFPGTTRSGSASFRGGILSTIVPDDRGLIETDALTTTGMGGGPVFSINLAGIVGIIIGAEADNTGAISSYKILPLEDLAAVLNLTASPTACFADANPVTPDLMAQLEALKARIQALENTIMGVPPQ